MLCPTHLKTACDFKMESRRKHCCSGENLATHLQLHQQMKLWWKMQHESGQSLFSSFIESKAWTQRRTYRWNMSGIIKEKPSVHPCNVCTCAQLQSPRSRKMVCQGITGSTWGGWRASGRVIRNPEKPLNPAEFLSSTTAPLGDVRSLWRERGKTGTVRNKAPNSHDMFS